MKKRIDNHGHAPRIKQRFSGQFGTLLPVSLFLTLGLLSIQVRAQQPLPEAAPPTAAPVVLSLEDLVRLGLERQPALTAARASLASAQVQSQALANLRFGALINHELPIRRQQACLGVTIASAGVTQAEWETVYAVTRNYFSVMYALEQEKVAKELVETLRAYHDTVQGLLKNADPDVKLTLTPGDAAKLSVNADLFQLRLIQASIGAERARAALREALGVEPCYPLLLVPLSLPPRQAVPCVQELLALALAQRGELIQVANAVRVVELEVCAQGATHALTARTFAAGSDIHATPIPHGVSNTEYRPGALGIEMPTTFAGRREDRMQRARELSVRANAAADKTRNLIALEVQDAYLKWAEAEAHLRALQGTRDNALKVRKVVEAQLQNKGAVTGEDLIRGKTLESQVLAQYNQALYEHALALAALERITAGGFTPGFRHGAIVLGP